MLVWLKIDGIDGTNGILFGVCLSTSTMCNSRNITKYIDSSRTIANHCETNPVFFWFCRIENCWISLIHLRFCHKFIRNQPQSQHQIDLFVRQDHLHAFLFVYALHLMYEMVTATMHVLNARISTFRPTSVGQCAKIKSAYSSHEI